MIFVAYMALVLDIQHQADMLNVRWTAPDKQEKAIAALVNYGELSYFVLKDYQVTEYAGGRLRQVVFPQVLRERTKRLINDLKDADFDVREKAEQELNEIGKYNRLFMLTSLGGVNDLEQKYRLQRIVDDNK
jgi:hypothetical protein